MAKHKKKQTNNSTEDAKYKTEDFADHSKKWV